MPVAAVDKVKKITTKTRSHPAYDAAKTKTGGKTQQTAANILRILVTDRYFRRTTQSLNIPDSIDTAHFSGYGSDE